eukprot:1391500-Amorphochlora_amoeboformis.AAC.2
MSARLRRILGHISARVSDPQPWEVEVRDTYMPTLAFLTFFCRRVCEGRRNPNELYMNFARACFGLGGSTGQEGSIRAPKEALLVSSEVVISERRG